MNSHVPITQLQHLSTHGQVCSIHMPTVLSLPPLHYFNTNPSPPVILSINTLMFTSKRRTLINIVTPPLHQNISNFLILFNIQSVQISDYLIIFVSIYLL